MLSSAIQASPLNLVRALGGDLHHISHTRDQPWLVDCLSIIVSRLVPITILEVMLLCLVRYQLY